MSEAFEGHEPRECGEHRTVGPHRAWCFDCSEWCYPNDEMACKGCRIPKLEAALSQQGQSDECERYQWDKWYLAVCQGCSRIRPKPFPGEDERDRWARAHREATGHQVARVTYAAPQADHDR